MITRRTRVWGRPLAPRKPKRDRFSAVRFRLPAMAPIRMGAGPKVLVWAAAGILIASAFWPKVTRRVPEEKTFLVDAEMLEPPKPLPPPEPPPRKLPEAAPAAAPERPAAEPPQPPPRQFGLDEEDLGEESDLAVAMGNTVEADADSVIQPPPPEREPAADPRKGKVVSVARVERMPRIRVAAKPEYTAEMREAGIAGKVKARLLVDSDGQVVQVEILQDIGYGTREASLRALKRVRFEPATLDGSPVAVWIPFSFSYEWQE